MTPKLQNMTIRHKLIFMTMIICVGALFLTAGMFIAWEWISLHRSLLLDLSTKAEMVADNCKAALAFEDVKDAKESLKSLRVEPSIVFGCIYNNKERIFAAYSRNDADIHFIKFQQNGYSFANKSLTVFKPVVLDGETVGTVCLQSGLNSVYRMLTRSVSTTISVLLMVSLLAYLVSSRFQKIISSPILSLANVAKAISGRKDYSVRVPEHGSDELGLLVNAFNEMLGQIQQRDLMLVDTNEQLELRVQQRTAELTKEISERKQAEEALEILNEELENTVEKLTLSNRELGDFAHITAHDLKAPLRAIGTLASWISTDYADKFDEQGREQVKLLVTRAERMSKLIDSILQYSEVGRVVSEKEIINLNTLTEKIIAEMAPPENIEIVVRRELPAVECEKNRIIQILQNLIGNAVRYMDKPHGRIEIDFAEENEFWKFSVSDNGPGIEEKYFEKIFRIFQTLKPRDEIESIGIGLAVVKKIVEVYGGKVWVESELGKGSTFFFTFPKSKKDSIKLQAQSACN